MTCVAKVVMFKLCLLLLKDQIVALSQPAEIIERINATIGESVLFSANCTPGLNRSVEWKYSCEASQTSIVAFPFGERDLNIFQGYKDRVKAFENGSFLLSDVQLNDTGCYTVTLVDTAGSEVTLKKILSVFEAESDKPSKNGINNTTSSEKNWRFIGTISGVSLVGICVICAGVVYFIRRRQQESTGTEVPGMKSNENLNSNIPMVVYSTYVGTFANYGKSRQTLDKT